MGEHSVLVGVRAAVGEISMCPHRIRGRDAGTAFRRRTESGDLPRQVGDELVYVNSRKGIHVGHRTTWISLTAAGRRALTTHVAALRELIAGVE